MVYLYNALKIVMLALYCYSGTLINFVKTMSVLLLATIILLRVSEVISNCPPDSGM